MNRLGLGDHAKKSARCPLHDDQHNSFSVWQSNDGAWFFKCHAGCGDGDEISFLGLYENLSPGVAIKRYFDLAGLNGSSSVHAAEPFDWMACVDAFTDGDLERLADWRGLSGQFCSWLRKHALVGSYENRVAFPVHDDAGRIIGAHVRQADGSWFYTPAGIKTRPLVIGSPNNGAIHIFESQWDAFTYMDALGKRDGVTITRGAQNGSLAKDHLNGSSLIYLWTQNDAPGEKWQKDICAIANTAVKRVQIPRQYKDLNRWSQAGRALSDELRAAIANAETVKQAERSWSDALKEGVVTARELHELELQPRRKLLGEWFCEGDLGFIFASRGVGKTWFALGVARALSNGGEFGHWRAYNRVKVLYVDGEMPPDLMRDRCDGLNGCGGELEFLNHEILFERTNKVLNITEPEVQSAITKRCVATGTKVLILDNLSTLASGMKENEADSWELVNKWLLELRRLKIAVIILHHAGRSGEMRGTSKREDNVFWTVVLDDTKKDADDKRGARFVSRFTKPSRNTQDEIPAYQWHLVTDNATGQVSVSCKQTQTLELFRQCIEEGVTDCTELAEELKVSRGTISKWAKKGQNAGWLKKNGRSYELVDDAESA
jgi:putative DNA primase/helicase